MANLTRYEPLSEHMERMFSTFRDDPFFRQMANWGQQWNGSEEGTLPVDIVETQDEIVVRAAVPGVTKDQMDIQLHEGVLSIKVQPLPMQYEGTYYRREYFWGPKSRRIALPGIVRDTNITAELKDGVLTLHVLKPEQAKPRQIEVKAE